MIQYTICLLYTSQNEKYIKPAGIEEIKEFLSVKPGLVKLFSMSPKGEASLEAIKYLRSQGVVVSIGHSAVFFDDVQKAIKAGLGHSTHTFNGMRGINHRELGVAGAVLNSDDIMAEVIFDKIHVHPETVRLMIRAKGVDKIECITDAMSATGPVSYTHLLLICTKGQTREMIKSDIETALKYFKGVTINIFIDNGTVVKRDNELVKWFVENYLYLMDDDRVELLIDNKDLGVFEQ